MIQMRKQHTSLQSHFRKQSINSSKVNLELLVLNQGRVLKSNSKDT